MPAAIPPAVEEAIARGVPAEYAYVPTRIPSGWRYRAWDAGRETPGLFPRGRGLNIWFTTPHPSGAGFHVYADRRCRRETAMRRFRFGRIVVAWRTNFGDDRAWRCVPTRRGMLQVSLSFVGSTSLNVDLDARRAEPVARMLVGIKRAR
jgi:hypothetical protein